MMEKPKMLGLLSSSDPFLDSAQMSPRCQRSPTPKEAKSDSEQGRRAPMKLCRVCGDKARGFNFGALSCESCKAFFTRRALSGKRFRCPFECPGKCRINVVTRRLCQSCRYDRCLAIGMQLASVRREEASRRRQAEKAVKAKEDKKASPSECSCTCRCGFYPKGAPLPTAPSTVPSPELPSPPAHGHVPHLDDVASVIADAMAPELLPSDLAGVQLEPMHANTVAILDVEDQARLATLMEAAEELRMEEAATGEVPMDVGLTQLANLSADVIRCLVRMFTRVEGFASLPSEDQMLLLKGSMMDLLVLHGLMTYNSETDSMRAGSHSVPARSVLPISDGDAYGQLRMYLWSFKSEWRSNETVMLLLMCQVAFDPSKPGLSNPAVVEAYRGEYENLLRRYLSATYEGSQGEWALNGLRQRLGCLPALRNALLRIFEYTPVQELEPLVVELFDLSPAASPTPMDAAAL